MKFIHPKQNFLIEKQSNKKHWTCAWNVSQIKKDTHPTPDSPLSKQPSRSYSCCFLLHIRHNDPFLNQIPEHCHIQSANKCDINNRDDNDDDDNDNDNNNNNHEKIIIAITIMIQKC